MKAEAGVQGSRQKSPPEAVLEGGLLRDTRAQPGPGMPQAALLLQRVRNLNRGAPEKRVLGSNALKIQGPEIHQQPKKPESAQVCKARVTPTLQS